ncbi:MAG TPA: hypothetical protein VKV26_13120 [Dehalococcoidia bacterium]|nr:hypothetical protein [Dehalococcoidia bacterium]
MADREVVVHPRDAGRAGVAILDRAARHNLGISSFVAAGNKADVSTADLVHSSEDDDATGVIAV